MTLSFACTDTGTTSRKAGIRQLSQKHNYATLKCNQYKTVAHVLDCTSSDIITEENLYGYSIVILHWFFVQFQRCCRAYLQYRT